MNISSFTNIQQDDANLQDEGFDINQLREIGLYIPSNITDLDFYISDNVQQIRYPRCLPQIGKQVKLAVQSLAKYFKTVDIPSQDKKKILVKEFAEIFAWEEMAPIVTTGAAITLGLLGGGLTAFIVSLFTPVGMAGFVTGSIIGAVVGFLASESYKKEIYDFVVGSRSDLLLQAENELNLESGQYTQEDLEEVYRNDIPVYHPDRYRTIQQKKIFAKKYIRVRESYEIIKQLKNWQ
ncbi:hypothetical protein ABPG72_006734 [Tetrahymena utriculariae]